MANPMDEDFQLSLEETQALEEDCFPQLQYSINFGQAKGQRYYLNTTLQPRRCFRFVNFGFCTFQKLQLLTRL